MEYQRRAVLFTIFGRTSAAERTASAAAAALAATRAARSFSKSRRARCTENSVARARVQRPMMRDIL